MKAEIVSVGTELLLGDIVDTNAAYLAKRLPALGIDLYWVSTVGDNLGRLVDVLKRAWQRSDLIIITGGIGPTEDDLTRDGIAVMLGEHLAIDPGLEVQVRGRFDKMGMRMSMPESNMRQAMLIPSARGLPNPNGTAPGWWVEKDGRVIVSMPGVPFEMYRMWEQQAEPRLRQITGGGMIWSRTLKVLGLGEAAVEEKIQDLVHSTNPTAATYAKADGIHVRVTAKAATEADAQDLAAGLEAEIRGRLGNYIYGSDNQTLEGVVAGLLRAKRLTVSVVEQSTGGFFASTLTNASNLGDVFKGALIIPPNGDLSALGVDVAQAGNPKVGSTATAILLAQIARSWCNADVGVGITGVAGTEAVGDVLPGMIQYAVDIRGRVTSGGRVWPSSVEEYKRRATLGAMNHLRLDLLDA
jgi:nicotinamide-nucleotide amidase